MPTAPRSVAGAIRAVASRVSTSTSRRVALVAVLALAARVLTIATALRVASGDGAAAVIRGLAVPDVSPSQAVFELAYLARVVISGTLPQLAANVLAAVAVAPILVRSRALAIAASALAVSLGA